MFVLLLITFCVCHFSSDNSVCTITVCRLYHRSTSLSAASTSAIELLGVARISVHNQGECRCVAVFDNSHLLVSFGSRFAVLKLEQSSNAPAVSASAGSPTYSLLPVAWF